MKELIEQIAKALVDNPDQVSVHAIEGEQTTVLELRVAQSDLGKVIGKQGRTARSIRTILSAAGMKLKKRFTLEGRYRGPRVYVFCTGYSPTSFTPFAERARNDPAWRYHELPTHHYPQVSLPRETAGVLLNYA